MRIAAVVIVIALAGLPAAAFAQPASPTPAPAPAEKSTAKSSGDVTRDQYIERAKEQAGARFDRMDTDHDGVLTRDEMRAYRSSHHRRSRSKAAQPPAAASEAAPKQQ